MAAPTTLSSAAPQAAFNHCKGEVLLITESGGSAASPHRHLLR